MAYARAPNGKISVITEDCPMAAPEGSAQKNTTAAITIKATVFFMVSFAWSDCHEIIIRNSTKQCQKSGGARGIVLSIIFLFTFTHELFLLV